MDRSLSAPAQALLIDLVQQITLNPSSAYKPKGCYSIGHASQQTITPRLLCALWRLWVQFHYLNSKKSKNAMLISHNHVIHLLANAIQRSNPSPAQTELTAKLNALALPVVPGGNRRKTKPVLNNVNLAHLKQSRAAFAEMFASIGIQVPPIISDTTVYSKFPTPRKIQIIRPNQTGRLRAYTTSSSRRGPPPGLTKNSREPSPISTLTGIRNNT